ncbi:V-type proton ATPase subunit E [Ruminococcaceae bacterium OttesenSCG-928-I18]|nr:V-type proton ATPase subunit E [Ruminococcaceae bacterium OttesenSCG-928-I18]
MNDFNQMELRRETIFKDSVLSLAEAQSMEIIAEAGKKRAEELEQAYKLSGNADYDTVKEKYFQESNKEFTAVASQARQELLQFREELVEGMFAEVREKLQQFTQSGDYAIWLAVQLKKHAAMAEGGKPLTVYLREADRGEQEALSRVMPAAGFDTDEDILLGGLKVSDGHVLFDETLDEKLREEQQRFYESGEMRL